jgi:hypothetical protein
MKTVNGRDEDRAMNCFQLKSKSGLRNLQGLLLLGAIACTPGVFAADVPAPVGPKTGPDNSKDSEKEILNAIDEQPFKFEMGERRDPFVFISKVPIIKSPPVGGVPGENVRVDIDPETVKRVKAEAEAFYGNAEKAFMEFSREGKAQEAIGLCDEGLKIFAQYPEAPSVPGWTEIREKLMDLRKAAERVKMRQDAKKKFEDLNIRLTGIVKREKNSQAIINSRAVRKGDVVAASDDYDVVVDEIRVDQVVFVFQGFKMALNLADSPK